MTFFKPPTSWWTSRHTQRRVSRNLWLRLLLGGTTLIVSTSAYYSYRVLRSLMLEKIEEKVFLKVKIGADTIDGWLATLTARIDSLANTPIIETMDLSVIDPYLQESIEEQSDFFKYMLALPDGSYYNSVFRTLTPENIGDRLYFQRSIAGKNFVSDPIVSRSTGVHQVNISTPIWSSEINPKTSTQPPIGVFVGSVTVDRITEVVGQLEYGEGSYAFALNSQGRAIVHPNPALMSTREQPATSLMEAADSNLAAIAKRMVRQQQGLELVQLDGAWKYVAYMPFRETNWSIALVMPPEAIESQLKLLDRVAVVVVLLAVTLIVVLWRVQSFEQTQLKKSEAVLAEKNERLLEALAQLKQTQAQLVQTEKMSGLGQMVAGIAHEINNPVSFISGNLTHANDYVRDLLDLIAAYQSEYPDPSPHLQEIAEEIEIDFLTTDLPKILNSMQVGSDRIRNIVLSLRNFSRLDESEMKPVNIHEGIDSTLLILHYRLKAKSVRVAGTEYHRREIQVKKKYGNLPDIECYPAQLNQVFMNILANAVDALEEGWQQRSPQEKIEGSSTITITTEQQEDSRALICIADNGMGISPEKLSQIFNPFFTTKPIGKGTGLGLSVSYQIAVDKHGGKLWCESVLGQGTEFFIQIPVRQA